MVLQKDSSASIPGIAELRALPRHPALGQKWRDVERVLGQHQRKVVEAEQELHKLAYEPGNLHATDLLQAKEAIERLKKELDDQRLVFLEYVGRCLQVSTNTAAPS